MKKIPFFKELGLLIRSKFNILKAIDPETDNQETDQEITSKKDAPDFKPFDLDTIFAY